MYINRLSETIVHVVTLLNPGWSRTRKSRKFIAKLVFRWLEPMLKPNVSDVTFRVRNSGTTSSAPIVTVATETNTKPQQAPTTGLQVSVPIATAATTWWEGNGMDPIKGSNMVFFR
jgi:hypothetical protein